MSFWTKIRNGFEVGAAGALGFIAGGPAGAAIGAGAVLASNKSASYDVSQALGAQSKDEKRQQQKLMNDQISEYKKQTELSKQEMNIAKDAKNAEQRRIQEKQIRAVRRNSSMRGFLSSSGDEMDSGVNSKLGT